MLLVRLYLDSALKQSSCSFFVRDVSMFETSHDVFSVEEYERVLESRYPLSIEEVHANCHTMAKHCMLHCSLFNFLLVSLIQSKLWHIMEML